MKLDLFLSLLGRQEVQFGKLVISLSFLRLRSWSVCLKTMYQSPHLFLLETLTYQGGQTIWPWDLTWPLQMCLAACICTCLGIPGCRLGTSSRCFLTRHWTCLCLMSRCELIIGKDNKLWESPSPFVGDSPQPPPPQGVWLPCFGLGLRLSSLNAHRSFSTEYLLDLLLYLCPWLLFLKFSAGIFSYSNLSNNY